MNQQTADKLIEKAVKTAIKEYAKEEKRERKSKALHNTKMLLKKATEYDKKQLLEEKRPKSWCKSVSAFANGVGGILIFGIADDDSIVGLADSKLCGE